jgi:hypothetical protein
MFDDFKAICFYFVYRISEFNKYFLARCHGQTTIFMFPNSQIVPKFTTELQQTTEKINIKIKIKRQTSNFIGLNFTSGFTLKI